MQRFRIRDTGVTAPPKLQGTLVTVPVPSNYPGRVNTAREKEGEIGRGVFGKVYLTKHQGMAALYCVKVVSLANDVDHEDALQEVKVMQDTCDHPNIVSLHAAWSYRATLHIVMEYCPGGSLDKFIAFGRTHPDYKHGFPVLKVLHYVQELSGALAYCHHSLRIVHRDLKPANILIGWLGTLKLADFGMAKALGPHTDMCATYCGSPLYMSPEQCTGKPYSFAADIWALGCISYELMALTSPWVGDGRVPPHATIVDRIVHATPAWALLRERYPENLVKLTRWMLLKDASERAMASELVQHLSLPEVPAVCEASVVVRPRVSDEVEKLEARVRAAACQIQRSYRERAAPRTPAPVAQPAPVPMAPSAPAPAPPVPLVAPPSTAPSVHVPHPPMIPFDKERPPPYRAERYRAPAAPPQPTPRGEPLSRLPRPRGRATPAATPVPMEQSALIIQKAFVNSFRRAPSRLEQLAAPRRTPPLRTKAVPPRKVATPVSPRKAWA